MCEFNVTFAQPSGFFLALRTPAHIFSSQKMTQFCAAVFIRFCFWFWLFYIINYLFEVHSFDVFIWSDGFIWWPSSVIFFKKKIQSVVFQLRFHRYILMKANDEIESICILICFKFHIQSSSKVSFSLVFARHSGFNQIYKKFQVFP